LRGSCGLLVRPDDDNTCAHTWRHVRKRLAERPGVERPTTWKAALILALDIPWGRHHLIARQVAGLFLALVLTRQFALYFRDFVAGAWFAFRSERRFERARSTGRPNYALLRTTCCVVPALFRTLCGWSSPEFLSGGQLV
jgi:hypothetical protein